MNLSWPPNAVMGLRAAFAEARTLYRTHPAHDLGPARLTMSAFFGTAYLQARERRVAWLDTVLPGRSSARGGPPYRQMAFNWPLGLDEIMEHDFDRLDAVSSLLWGEGFRLTKSHLVLAAIQHGLRSSQVWLHLVPNDPRVGPRARSQTRVDERVQRSTERLP